MPLIKGLNHLVLTITNILITTLLISTSQARISVMYAHDKLSDMVAQQCLSEMFPKTKHMNVQESDEACIIFCVLKKFGIMNSSGDIHLEMYRKRVRKAHQLGSKSDIKNIGSSCLARAEAAQHNQDVCRKAKVFNDCTHLYKMLVN